MRYIRIRHLVNETGDWRKVYTWEIGAYGAGGRWGLPPQAQQQSRSFRQLLGVNGIWGWGNKSFSDTLAKQVCFYKNHGLYLAWKNACSANHFTHGFQLQIARSTKQPPLVGVRATILVMVLLCSVKVFIDSRSDITACAEGQLLPTAILTDMRSAYPAAAARCF